MRAIAARFDFFFVFGRILGIVTPHSHSAAQCFSDKCLKKWYLCRGRILSPAVHREGFGGCGCLF
jgi:hypothetical protein